MSREADHMSSDGAPRHPGVGQAHEPVMLLNLPDGVLGRIVQVSDYDTRRQLRLVSRTLRPLVDACTASLTLSSYSLPCIAARGFLPDFAPQLRSVTLALQDIAAPAGFLARLPRLGLAQLPHLNSITLSLANDHSLPPTALSDLASAIPTSTTRLVLTHMIGAGRPPSPQPQRAGGWPGLQRADASASAGRGGGASAAAAAPQLDFSALRHLLRLCPQVREVRLDGGCWVRGGADLRALASLLASSQDDAAAAAAMQGSGHQEARGAGPPAGFVAGGSDQSDGDDGSAAVGAATSPPPFGAMATSGASSATGAVSAGAGVAISSIRGLYLDAVDGYLDLPRTLAALSGLAALDVQLVATAVRQLPAADAAGDVGGLLADVAAALNMAHLGLASEQLLRGLAAPALAGLTRLVVREFQGNTMALLGALEGLPLLAHLGLSGLDDAPYITDSHLELLARLPSLKHLAVDRLDISRDRQQQQQSFCTSSGATAGSYHWDSGSAAGTCSILPGLTGLEVALVVHSGPRLPHAFPAVQHLTLRWLWEQAMRKLAGWTSLTCLSLANLDCCLDWGLLRTLTGLTQLQLCRGSSYEQLAELLYLLRALPGLQVLRLSGWHCMRNSEPGRMTLGLTRGLGAAGLGMAGGRRAEPGWGQSAGSPWRRGTDIADQRGDLGVNSGDAAAQQERQQEQELQSGQAGTSGAEAEVPLRDPDRPGRARTHTAHCSAPGSPRSSGTAAAAEEWGPPQHPDQHNDYRAPLLVPVVRTPTGPSSSGSGAVPAAASASTAAMAAAFAALDPDLHRAWARIRTSPDATGAAGAAMTLLHALPRLDSLELTDCGHPILRCLASRALLEDAGPLAGLRELRLSRLLDVVGSDVEEVVAALPGLRRLTVQGCWPVDGEALLHLEGLRRSGVDVVWRR